MPGSLQVQDVAVILSDKSRILDGASVEFAAGKSTVIVGPSGSGKSTLLKTAGFLRPPEQGQVLYEGVSIASMTEAEHQAFRRRTGFMFQDGALWANMSIYENLALPVRYHFPKYKDSDVRDHVLGVLDKFGFRGDIQLRPSAFSAGRQKLVSFIRAVITEPDMLLVDEPSTFMDWRSLERLHFWTKEFSDSGKTFVMVTHEAELARSFARNLVVVDEGKILEWGPLEQVLESENPLVQNETRMFHGKRN